MPDEQTGVIDTANPASTGTESTQTEGQQETTAPNLPEFDKRFGAGKSLAEVQKMVLEQDSELGRRAELLGKVQKVDVLENQLAYMQEQLGRMAQERQAPVQQQRQPEYDPLNPDPYIDSKVDAKINRLTQNWQAYEENRAKQEFGRSFTRGRQALSSDAELFGGIEREVEQGVMLGVRSNIISPADLTDPETWQNVARAIRIQRREWDKVIPRKTGMASQSSERPGATRRLPDDESFSLSPEDLAMAREDGIDEKTATELARGEYMRNESRRRGNR